MAPEVGLKVLGHKGHRNTSALGFCEAGEVGEPVDAVVGEVE